MRIGVVAGAAVVFTLVIMPRLISIRTDSTDLIPLSVLTEEYQQDALFSPENTRKAKEQDLKVFREYLAETLRVRSGAVLIGDVNPAAVAGFRDYRLAIESPTTVNRRLSTIKHLFSVSAERRGTKNPAAAISKAPVAITEFKGLTEEQLSALRDHPADRSPRARFTIELLTLTGLRNDEARNIILGDISDDFSAISIRGKGNKLASVPLPPPLLREFNRYMDWRYQWSTRPEMPLLLSRNEGIRNKPSSWHVNNKTIWYDVHTAAVEAGIPDSLAHPHTLRHTFARRLLSHLSPRLGAAEALNIVRIALRHSSLASTMNYLTESKDAIYDAVSALG